MKRFYRSTKSNVIGGVCGGLGEYTNIDPLFWRLGFITANAFAPHVLLVYIVLWCAATLNPNENENT
jgi:phage shock protein C